MLIRHCFTIFDNTILRFPSCVICVCLCACSPSGQSDSGALCVGDGVASEHRPGQKLHLALLREWPAAGDVSHCRLGFRTTVSFNPPSLHPPSPPLLLLFVDLSPTWPLECAQWTWQLKLPAKWSEVDVTKQDVTSHLCCWGLWKIS